MLVNSFTMLAQLDAYRLAGMFWYVLVMEIPRFTLGLVVVSRLLSPQALAPRGCDSEKTQGSLFCFQVTMRGSALRASSNRARRANSQRP